MAEHDSESYGRMHEDRPTMKERRLAKLRLEADMAWAALPDDLVQLRKAVRADLSVLREALSQW